MATASIKDPIIKKTASLINDDATPSAVSTPKTTSIIKINIAIAGNGMDSETIKIKAVTTMIAYDAHLRLNPLGFQHKKERH